MTDFKGEKPTEKQLKGRPGKVVNIEGFRNLSGEFMVTNGRRDMNAGSNQKLAVIDLGGNVQSCPSRPT